MKINVYAFKVPSRIVFGIKDLFLMIVRQIYYINNIQLLTKFGRMLLATNWLTPEIVDIYKSLIALPLHLILNNMFALHSFKVTDESQMNNQIKIHKFYLNSQFWCFPKTYVKNMFFVVSTTLYNRYQFRCVHTFYPILSNNRHNTDGVILMFLKVLFLHMHIHDTSRIKKC